MNSSGSTDQRPLLNIALFGPPGAGKGTQSEKIIQRYGLVHLSTGDLFRKHIKEQTALGLKAQSYINQGALVPDEITIGMVDEKINDSPEAKGFIFDGFPRNVNQAKALDRLLNAKNCAISTMISLEVPEDELKTRLKQRAKISGRVDDQDPKKIQTRLDIYAEETLPVAAYYYQQEKLMKVNGVGSIDEIFREICTALDPLQS